jgi:hypothetical protein
VPRVLSSANQERLEFDEGPGQACAGAIEKKPHALCLSALNRDQTNLPTDVVDVGKVRDEPLIAFRIALEPRDPAFDALTKTGTDFVVLIHSAAEDHSGLPFFSKKALKYFRVLPILSRTDQPRQITEHAHTGNRGNRMSKNETGAA